MCFGSDAWCFKQYTFARSRYRKQSHTVLGWDFGGRDLLSPTLGPELIAFDASRSTPSEAPRALATRVLRYRLKRSGLAISYASCAVPLHIGPFMRCYMGSWSTLHGGVPGLSARGSSGPGAGSPRTPIQREVGWTDSTGKMGCCQFPPSTVSYPYPSRYQFAPQCCQEPPCHPWTVM